MDETPKTETRAERTARINAAVEEAMGAHRSQQQRARERTSQLRSLRLGKPDDAG